MWKLITAASNYCDIFRDGFNISTPLVLNPLECLHKSGNSGHSNGVDILDVLGRLYSRILYVTK